MKNVPLEIIKNILLDIPGAKIDEQVSTSNKVVFVVNNVVIPIPRGGCSPFQLGDILQDLLEMDWWMIDYVFGQNGVVI